MIVLAMLFGIWVGEYRGPDAIYECELFASTYQDEIKCVVWTVE
jgi:hypothetical protein